MQPPPAPDARPRSARLSRPARDLVIRVVAALSERDDIPVAYMMAEGFRVEQCTPEAIDETARALHAEAIVVDADLEGALAAVARVRRSEGVLATIPIVMVGLPGVALRTSLDAVEAGGDTFVPRPLAPADLAERLLELLEPQGGALSIPPDSTPPPPPVASRLAQAPTAGDAVDSTNGGAPREQPASQDAAAGVNALPASLAPAPLSAAGGAPAAGGSSGATSGLSPALAEVLRLAAVRAGGTEADLALPSLDDEAIDELIPPELLEPLDAPHDMLGDEPFTPAQQHTPPPYSSPPGAPPRRSSSRSMPAVAPTRGVISPTPTITPLAVGGEMRLSGALGRHGVGAVLGAASRARASGLVVVRTAAAGSGASGGAEYCLSLTSGHLLALRSSRPEHEIGPLLARLGAIPREAARFAGVPLDAGVRGAALIAARGYLTATALAAALARAARELLFDLLVLPEIEWEMRPLETAAEIPLNPRSLDALLVLGARARVEPGEARAALGGDTAAVSLRPEAASLGALPLSRGEREAVEFARGRPVRAIVEAFGPEVLPAMLALAWLGFLRVDGGSVEGAAAPAPPAALAEERTRVRALIEAAEGRDFFALLGVSEWATRAAALEALEARRGELAGLRARHPDVPALAGVASALDELAALLGDGAGGWDRYTLAVRERASE